MYEYFYHTRAERNATFVLACLCLMVLLFPTIATYLKPPDPPIDFSDLQEIIQQRELALSAASKADKGVKEKQAIKPPVLFAFDPNTVTKENLLRLGIPERVAQTLVNFRNKGGRFKEKEDLKKVYGLKKIDYDRLEPWINITSSKRVPKEIVRTETKAATFQKKAIVEKVDKTEREGEKWIAIDINRADNADWQELKGIGPAYARRILTFREALGGFQSIDQIGETYGLPDSTFQQIKPYLVLSDSIRKIAINTCDLQLLRDHPYINNYQATILYNYCQQNGPINGMGKLRLIQAGFEEADWSRLEGYFSFEEN